MTHLPASDRTFFIMRRGCQLLGVSYEAAVGTKRPEEREEENMSECDA